MCMVIVDEPKEVCNNNFVSIADDLIHMVATKPGIL